MLLVPTIAVVTTACIGDKQTRDEISHLEDRDCTVFCELSGPDFIRDFFLPNFGRTASLIALQRDDFKGDYISPPPLALAQIDDKLVAQLKNANAAIYASNDQVAEIRQHNTSLKLIGFDDARSLIDKRRVASCGHNQTLHTSPKHLVCTTIFWFAGFFLARWLVNRRHGTLVG